MFGSSFLRDKITVLAKLQPLPGTAGLGSDGVQLARIGRLRANVGFAKGARPLLEGVLEAYDEVLVRTRLSARINRDCLVELPDGRVCTITSYNADRHARTLQMTVKETKSFIHKILKMKRKILSANAIIRIRVPGGYTGDIRLSWGQSQVETLSVKADAMETMADGHRSFTFSTGGRSGWLTAQTDDGKRTRLCYLHPAGTPIIMFVVDDSGTEGFTVSQAYYDTSDEQALPLIDCDGDALRDTDGVLLTAISKS